ncbi:MAG: glycosyltransferase family 4 protein, partial [Dehalococcoidia bacterium]|nr:glycosyltransferase family 4 protein [Dehalococcoidia bacterium]
LYIIRGFSNAHRRRLQLLTDHAPIVAIVASPLADPSASTEKLTEVRVGFIGNRSDPHRGWYQTLDFAIRRRRPDVIHADEEPDSLPALQLAIVRGLFAPSTPLVLNMSQNIDRPKSLAVRTVLGATLRSATMVCCVNSEGAQLARRYGFRGSPIVMTHDGVDTSVFWPAEQPPPRPPFIIVYAGRLVPAKGVDTLVHALALLPDEAQLVVAGDGPERQRLQDLAAPLGDRARFVGSLPPDELAGLFRRAHALVLPSRTTPVWKEQFGRVLAEAMACGLPMVGSRSGAIPEVIGDAGLVFDEGDSAALASCLRRLMTDDALWQDCRARGLERVHARYTQRRVVEQLADLYRSVARR